MTLTPRHREVEERMLDLLESAGLPAPDDIGHLSRAVVFLWYDTKAFVLVDLEEMPPDGDPLEGLDVGALAADLAIPGTGFIEAA